MNNLVLLPKCRANTSSSLALPLPFSLSNTHARVTLLPGPASQHNVVGRRKSGGGGTTQLRSPVVKRPASAPVALQGWLHKQGSEGLMLWKKRWFVLSEYCLFYYKGQGEEKLLGSILLPSYMSRGREAAELHPAVFLHVIVPCQGEEKLLGSILLPSYKVSPCSAADDRVYRKFSFKAEHANMRTYYFSADSRELMVQWMNALSLASILQEGSSWEERQSARPSFSSVSSLLNQSADDSDSGFHGYRSRPGTNKQSAMDEGKDAASAQLSTSHDSAVSNGWSGPRPSPQGVYHQPLYANAPPKPRRMGGEYEDCGTVSSPDVTLSAGDTGVVKKVENECTLGPEGYSARLAQPQQPVRNVPGGVDVVRYHYQSSQRPHLVAVAPSAERRTPDTYGRSNSTTPGVKAIRGGDYEDVYNCDSASGDSVTHVYRRPSGQVAYIKGAGPPLSIHHKPTYPGRHALPLQNIAQPMPLAPAMIGYNYTDYRYASGTPSHDPSLTTSTAQPSYYLTTPTHQQPTHQQPTHHHHHHQSVQQQPPAVPPHQVQTTRHPPRPHSADFLDYDAKRYYQYQGYHTTPLPYSRHVVHKDHSVYGSVGTSNCAEPQASRAKLQRPKSSLDVMPSADIVGNDGYYWSEEHYAQKMRQSATYLHQTPPAIHHRNQSSFSRATTPSVRLTTPLGVNTIDGGMVSQPAIAPMGGVSSGGSVNSESAGVVMRHPKRVELVPTEAGMRSPSRQQYQQQQQRRWSEYTDPRTDGQFMRSASARLPRQKYEENEDSQEEEQRKRSTSDTREGEKKIQQREESMKRLLEWKQRMLQSPLSRKPSGSSTRGTAQNELSKYYKQQVLRELANQEARLRDESRSSREESRGSRRRVQQDDNTSVYGRSSGRSRSQDGRRSSTSINRYNSYSSDDEELGDIRKARKRVRRPSQAGRSRQNSAEGKPSRRHHSTVPPQNATSARSTTSYENVTMTPKTTRRDSHKIETSEIRKLKNSSTPMRFEEIPPDVDYGNQSSYTVISRNKPKTKKNDFHEGKISLQNSEPVQPSLKPNKHNELIGVKSLSQESDKNVSYVSPFRHHKYPDSYLRNGNWAQKSSGESTGYPSLQDDRCSNGKHSDSGYDTLQARRVFPADETVASLLKFQKNDSRKHTEFVYPAQWDGNRKDDRWKSKIDESQLVKEFTYEYISPKKSVADDKKSVSSSRKAETPPKNIVQNRIKAFEIDKEESSQRITKETFQMQEPLKMSPPMYQPNEAHVSSLKNMDGGNAEVDVSTSSGIIHKSELRNFIFGDTPTIVHSNTVTNKLVSSKDNAEYAQKDLSTLMNCSKIPGKNSKSVKDLLADFERKSQMMKEKQAAENEKSSEDGHGRRFVFSDTETLLYDTSSDAEGDRSRATPVLTTNPRSESHIYQSYTDEDDDKDEEVAAVLGKRERFFSSCRDLGRNRDPDYYGERRRRRRSSRASTATTDATGSDDLEVIMTTGYLRLSMAESLVTHEDSDSVCSTPIIQKFDSESKAENDITKKEIDKDNIMTVIEEHYVPMTPKKAVLAPPDTFGIPKSPSASQTIIMENIFGIGVECEESSYVEMTEEGFVRSLLAPDTNSSFLPKFDLRRLNSNDTNNTYATPDSPNYCEIGALANGNTGHSHYELLYRSASHYEPVYMEVSPLSESLKICGIDSNKLEEKYNKNETSGSFMKKVNSEKLISGTEDGVNISPPTPPRVSLPDILNLSNAASQNKPPGKSDRDSSDADDEASKDLDSLDAPRHPRFSLSDTFRPASYYLGASSISGRAMMLIGGVTTEHHDSSDSDLVSPPPIPTSPPPLDELDNSLDLQDSSLEIKKQFGIPTKTTNNAIVNDDRDELNKQLYIQNKLLESKKLHSSSNEIPSSGSDSVELRHSSRRNMSLDSSLKRRAVSDDVIGSLEDYHFLLDVPYPDRRSGSDLDSIGSRSGFAINVDDSLSLDIDHYLEELQTRDIHNAGFISKDLKYGCDRPIARDTLPTNDNKQTSSNNIPCTDDLPFLLSHNENGALNVARYRGRFSDPVNPQREDIEYLSEINKRRHSSPYKQAARPLVEEEVHYENLHIIPPPPEHASKVGDVEHKPVTGDELYPRSNGTNEKPVDTNAASVEGNSTSVLESTFQRGLVSENDDQQQAGAPYYYSDLLKSEEDGFASSTSEKSLNSTRGLAGYPHTAASFSGQSYRVNNSSRIQPLNNQRGHSSENIAIKRNDIGRKVNPINHVASYISSQQQHVETSEDEARRLAEELRATTVHFLGGDIWEEDALWRESLRRVSLRHTRSLDNLDGFKGRSNSQLSNISVATSSTLVQSAYSGRQSVDLLSSGAPRVKVSRDVIYVNECMARGPFRSHLFDQTRQREHLIDERKHGKMGQSQTNCFTNNDGVQEDDGIHYERLTRQHEKTRSKHKCFEGYPKNIDRPIFGKDDLILERNFSQEESHVTRPFLEESNHPSQPPPPESFKIDREKLRQWDLMSSAPLLQREMQGVRGMLGGMVPQGGVRGGVGEVGGGSNHQEYPHQQHTDSEDNQPPSSTGSAPWYFLPQLALKGRLHDQTDSMHQYLQRDRTQSSCHYFYQSPLLHVCNNMDDKKKTWSLLYCESDALDYASTEAAEVTEIPLPSAAMVPAVNAIEPPPIDKTAASSLQVGSSSSNSSVLDKAYDPQLGSSFYIHPEDVSHVPRASETKRKSNARRKASTSNERWIKCQGCGLWAHELCAGVGEENNEYLCETCS
uniref:PH domain-containing protein n=1 Tax=Timema monikensis TaxID=170555 RepID=A0A7R9E3C3_9NEOP|nr:unnamed protein product [Timema monikensis]